jgi:hypothetical protein
MLLIDLVSKPKSRRKYVSFLFASIATFHIRVTSILIWAFLLLVPFIEGSDAVTSMMTVLEFGLIAYVN